MQTSLNSSDRRLEQYNGRTRRRHAGDLLAFRAFGTFVIFAGCALALCDAAPVWRWYWLSAGAVVGLLMASTRIRLQVIGSLSSPLTGVLTFLTGAFAGSSVFSWGPQAGLRSFQEPMLMMLVPYSALTYVWLWRRPGTLASFIGGQFAAVMVALGLGVADATRTASILLGMQGACAIAALLSLSRHKRTHAALQRDHRVLRTGREEHAQLLEEALTVKANFLAAASHDLRQPAQALVLFVDELLGLPSTAEQNVLVTRIKAASDNLIAALGALTDIAKLDGLGIEPRTDIIDLHVLIERICSTFQPMADAKAIRLSYSNVDVCAIGDPSVLHAILANLVSNAIKYTDRGSVRVHTLSIGSDVEVCVQDTGRGIAEKDRPRIYEEFFRGSNAGSSESGMGLGLAIVRRLAHAANIPIRLESAIGVGSRFTLTLPVGRSSASSTMETSREHPGPSSGKEYLAGMRIVVLDNDPIVTQSMQEVLETWGATVHGLHSADALRELVAEDGGRINLLIVDHHLDAESDGFQAIEAFRFWGPGKNHVPVLMMTGNLDPQISRLAARRRISLAHKPIPPSRLKAIMLELLELGDSSDSSDFPITLQRLREASGRFC